MVRSATDVNRLVRDKETARLAAENASESTGIRKRTISHIRRNLEGGGGGVDRG